MRGSEEENIFYEYFLFAKLLRKEKAIVNIVK